jgi:hypothetical protein
MLRELQLLLARLYDVELAADVRDYLVTDPAWRGLAGDGDHAPAEQLLIDQEATELGLALYLDAGMLARIAALAPAERLEAPHRPHFFMILEGISHFNYVAWNALHDKSVTLLELEMQAEVDKYVCAHALQAAPDDASRAGLFGDLFDAPEFDPALGPARYDRYRHANHLAGRYCRSLSRRFPAGEPGPAMLREVRTFYRWPQPAKLSHIHTTLFA